jgi:hypothetical protein
MLMVLSAREPYPGIQYANRTMAGKDRWNLMGTTLLNRNSDTNFRGIVLADRSIRNGNDISPGKCAEDLRAYAGPPSGGFNNYSVAKMQFTAST